MFECQDSLMVRGCLNQGESHQVSTLIENYIRIYEEIKQLKMDLVLVLSNGMNLIPNYRQIPPLLTPMTNECKNYLYAQYPFMRETV